ncbi:uncharacterized protein MONBRDRAFT_30451 [Monosiga brevicollis MX1]|uniref:Ras-GEF domain-containing protein n=1 Tax=Monosiga brevicollis TaxID=81824 RepID=A9VE00_MONBE|nr:uncharacterized protein MONBRDRAFT_30451 [Monosiga brevicollis MX1]EDQ84218.1 predicted protein [Monosiga brevicollis MX1]|eukprot:XP_001750942.1 hypothetical protein [Monosiga brevicollis MX1]
MFSTMGPPARTADKEAGQRSSSHARSSIAASDLDDDLTSDQASAASWNGLIGTSAIKPQDTTLRRTASEARLRAFTPVRSPYSEQADNIKLNRRRRAIRHKRAATAALDSRSSRSAGSHCSSQHSQGQGQEPTIVPGSAAQDPDLPPDLPSQEQPDVTLTNAASRGVTLSPLARALALSSGPNLTQVRVTASLSSDDLASTRASDDDEDEDDDEDVDDNNKTTDDSSSDQDTDDDRSETADDKLPRIQTQRQQSHGPQASAATPRPHLLPSTPSQHMLALVAQRSSHRLLQNVPPMQRSFTHDYLDLSQLAGSESDPPSPQAQRPSTHETYNRNGDNDTHANRDQEVDRSSAGTGSQATLASTSSEGHSQTNAQDYAKSRTASQTSFDRAPRLSLVDAVNERRTTRDNLDEAAEMDTLDMSKDREDDSTRQKRPGINKILASRSPNGTRGGSDAAAAGATSPQPLAESHGAEFVEDPVLQPNNVTPRSLSTTTTATNELSFENRFTVQAGSTVALLEYLIDPAAALPWAVFKDQDHFEEDGMRQILGNIAVAAAASRYVSQEAARKLQQTIERMAAREQAELAQSDIVVDEPNVSLIMVSAEQLSDHMTLHNAALFARVQPSELVTAVLLNHNSPSLQRLIRRYDLEYYWIESEMLACKDPQLQTLMLDKFIAAATHCRQQNNFFSVFTIISCLDTAKMHKHCQQAFENISKECRRAFQRLVQFTSPDRNMRAYRNALKALSKKQPRVYFLPLFMKDLRFLADGNEKKIGSLYNVDRLRSLAESAREVTSLAALPFKRIAINEPLARLICYKENIIADELAGRLDSVTTSTRDHDMSSQLVKLQMQIEELTAALEARSSEVTRLKMAAAEVAMGATVDNPPSDKHSGPTSSRQSVGPGSVHLPVERLAKENEVLWRMLTDLTPLSKSDIAEAVQAALKSPSACKPAQRSSSTKRPSSRNSLPPPYSSPSTQGEPTEPDAAPMESKNHDNTEKSQACALAKAAAPESSNDSATIAKEGPSRPNDDFSMEGIDVMALLQPVCADDPLPEPNIQAPVAPAAPVVAPATKQAQRRALLGDVVLARVESAARVLEKGCLERTPAAVDIPGPGQESEVDDVVLELRFLPGRVSASPEHREPERRLSISTSTYLGSDAPMRPRSATAPHGDARHRSSTGHWTDPRTDVGLRSPTSPSGSRPPSRQQARPSSPRRSSLTSSLSEVRSLLSDLSERRVADV